MAKTTYKTDSYPYRVYTALLKQIGGDNPQTTTSGSLTVGVTYEITDYQGNDDFTNVGASSNTNLVKFVATGKTPTEWGNVSELTYNTGAPVVTVLENTLGNIWFTYDFNGQYGLYSNLDLFPVAKTFISVASNNDEPYQFKAYRNLSLTNIALQSFENTATGYSQNNGALILGDGGFLEIRVYN